jgi:hypothetical protein
MDQASRVFFDAAKGEKEGDLAPDKDRPAKERERGQGKG